MPFSRPILTTFLPPPSDALPNATAARPLTLEVTQGQILSQPPLFEVAFVWGLTKETIVLPLGFLQGGEALEEGGDMCQADTSRKVV